jgi:nitroreductase
VNESNIEAAARRLFTEARTCSRWLPRLVDEAQLRELYRLASPGPTSMNCQPVRLQFAMSAPARERLAACVNPGNVDKVLSAPVVAIVGQDLGFVDHLSVLFAHKTDARSYYDDKPDVVATTALRQQPAGRLPHPRGACCMCCLVASIASATTACWPTAAARAVWPRRASC